MTSDITDDLDKIKSDWVGVEFDLATFEVTEAKMLGWAEALGEQDPRFIDPSNPDFQAHPTFCTHLVSRRILPEKFPSIGRSGIDGGKAIEIHAPVRCGDTLEAVATIADVYPKTGRSGTMVFVVQRMSFTNQNGDPVATVDWRMIRNQ